jgi:hypothetical protein
MSPLTPYLARFIGLAMAVMCAALLLRPKASVAAIEGMVESPGLIMITGVFTLAGGAALVVAHNLWSGPAAAIAVTGIGWIALIKGAALIAAPPGVLAAFWRGVRYPQVFPFVMLAGLTFAVWLAWAGLSAAPGP